MAESYPNDLAVHVLAQLSAKTKSPVKLTALSGLFEILYFASLKHEEGQGISCRVAFINPKRAVPKSPAAFHETRWQHFAFNTEIPFTVRNLVKLAKAADPWVSTIAVYQRRQGQLAIWGLIDQSIHYSTAFMKESDDWEHMPGLFQAVIEGPGELSVYDGFVFLGSLRQGTLVRREIGVLQHGPVRDKLLPAISTFASRVAAQVGPSTYAIRDHWNASLEQKWVAALCRVLIGMRRYGHGGALLISNQPTGLKSKYPLTYPRLTDALLRAGVLLVRQTTDADTLMEEFIEKRMENLPTWLHLDESIAASHLEDTYKEITGCVRFVSSLARVDGLVWLKDDLTLQGFGVEITSKSDPSAIFGSSNAFGTSLHEIDMNDFGMRHRSMLRYCSRHPDSVGFVVSQDGDVRAITDVGGKTVLWDNIRLYSTQNVRTSSHH